MQDWQRRSGTQRGVGSSSSQTLRRESRKAWRADVEAGAQVSRSEAAEMPGIRAEAGAGEGGVQAAGAEGAEPSAASGYLALRGGQRGGNHTEPVAALC